jgi:protein-tyrosine-phosphatase
MAEDNGCPIKRILFVDGDNVLESAIAEALTQYEADKHGVDITASSVGVNASDGSHRYATTVKISFGQELGQADKYDSILRGTTKQMTPERLRNSDLIVTLSKRYISAIKAMLPQDQWHKIVQFHLYCLGNRSKEFPEHALRNKNLSDDFTRACSNLILRMCTYPYYENVIGRQLDALRSSFIEQYGNQLVDGFSENELMACSVPHVSLSDAGSLLCLKRMGSYYILNLMFKDGHNSTSLSIADGSLDDIRQILYSENFSRDYAMSYEYCEQSYDRHMD